MIVSNMSVFLNNRMKHNQTNMEKAIQRLNTGKRIPHAAHDAAGLTISQKMKALIRGTEQAHRNVQDGHSLVQVADGAMEEIGEMIHRVRELTVQAMNGRNNDVDRLIIQNEIDELKRGINDVVDKTEFNTKKVLTNKEPGEYITEDRLVSKTIPMNSNSNPSNIVQNYNNEGMSWLSQNTLVSNQNRDVNIEVTTSVREPYAFIGSTVVDHRPQWSDDGETIVFTSSRDGGQYTVASNGSTHPEVKVADIDVASQRTMTTNHLMQLRHSGASLILERRLSTSHSWTQLQTYDYNHLNDGSQGYSFSPAADEHGNTSFVFSDVKGNVQKVNVNMNTFTYSSPIDLIPSTDVLNIPPANNTLTLPSRPDLYRMNTEDASFRVQKVNDNGARELQYWDGTGTMPDGGYTVSNNTITFFGNAVIGGEVGIDDAQDYYSFDYVTDGIQNNIYTSSLPYNSEIYNMNGEPGPRSLNIIVGGRTVTRDELLSERPVDVENTTGVFVDGSNGKIEFYGELRPAYNETVQIQHMADVDSRNEVYTFNLATGIDDYNLANPDLSTNRSLRVYLDGVEVPYGSDDGFTYNSTNGRVSLHGSYRPDLPTQPQITVDYVTDTSSTDKQVYGIPLYSTRPEIYNIEGTAEPKSIRVFRNGSEEIAYSDTDGYQYNERTNTLDLYGTSRPDTDDYYHIRMIAETSGVTTQNGIVEVSLTYRPETYGISDPAIPSTFSVYVDGNEISYDPTKTDGYFYNTVTNRIEIYGDARPDAENTFNPDVRAYYVYENPTIETSNDTYDFRLASDTLDYGVETEEQPRAMRVYYKGSEVPYDDNGFTYDPSTDRLSLHGSYRPKITDSAGDFRVYSIRESDLKVNLPNNNPYVYKVLFNGQEIDEAESVDGNGYIINGGQVELVGDARPDITNTTSSINLEVLYSEPLQMTLDQSAIQGFLEENCPYDFGRGFLSAEINPDSLVVSLNGATLSGDQYELQGGQVVLNGDMLNLGVGNHYLTASYEVRHPIGYEPNEFTFQVGANSGDSLKVEIASFDNMTFNTNVICVDSYQSANRSLEIADNALKFVMEQRGHMGAKMNRMESIASNLKVLEENTTAAMSRMEDADMAKEAMNMVKHQLISQVQQAMSQHIKQSSEQVIELLK